MLTCAATCRSRDKKPDGNILDVTGTSLNYIAEATHIESMMPDALTVTMSEEEITAVEYAEKTVKEAYTLTDLFAGVSGQLSTYSRALKEAQLVSGLYGEPQIAAFRSDADRHSGLIR